MTQPSEPRNRPHALWELHGFDTLSRIPPENPNKPHERTRYPLRYLRYWFIRMLLEKEARRLARPLRVCEVGVDRGQMLAFMGGDANGKGTFHLPAGIECWDAVDYRLRHDDLRRYSYSGSFEYDLNSDAPLPVGRYHAVVFLHVLEHLLEPERTLDRFQAALEPGGIFLGGSPTMPDPLVRIWEPKLRANTGPNGHVSVISPGRLRRYAGRNGMRMEFLSGAYFMRNGGKSIENSALWLRLNLAWGAAFPALGSEVYFAMRK